MKFRFIRIHARAYPIRLLCQVLRVSRSGYYAWAKKAAKGEREPRGAGETCLRLEVRAAFRRSGGTYGSPRVHQELREGGIRCGRKRVERIMRAEGLRATRPRRPPTPCTHCPLRPTCWRAGSRWQRPGD